MENNINKGSFKLSNFHNNFKLSLTTLLIYIFGILLLILIFTSYFENSNTENIKNNQFLKIIILIVFIYGIGTIVTKKKILSTKTSFMGLFTIETGLLKYLILIFIMAFLL
jgi:uncharacterized protein YqhQ